VDAATVATYALNRPGGDFVCLMDNLEFIASLGVSLKLSMVVQANNFFEMPKLADLAQSLGADCYFSQLINWGTFSRAGYADRAVHRPEHPVYPALCGLLEQLRGLPHV